MSIFGKIKHAVHHASHAVEHAAEHAAEEAKKKAEQVAHEAEEAAKKAEQEALKQVSSLADQAFGKIKSEVEHLGDSVKSDIEHAISQAKSEITHAADQAKSEIEHAANSAKDESEKIVNTAKDEIHKAFDEIVHELEDEAMMFGKAVADGLLLKTIDKALKELSDYPIEPSSFTLGFEFWNVGFGINIDDIPNKISKLEEYAGGKKSLHSAKDIEEFVLALAPTSLSTTAFGSGPTFNAEQIGDALLHVFAKFGIK